VKQASIGGEWWFLNAFVKVRKATVLSRHVRPSVPIEQLRSLWTDFDDIRYLQLFRKVVGNIQI
jgi:hypothetical protein